MNKRFFIESFNAYIIDDPLSSILLIRSAVSTNYVHNYITHEQIVWLRFYLRKKNRAAYWFRNKWTKTFFSLWIEKRNNKKSSLKDIIFQKFRSFLFETHTYMIKLIIFTKLKNWYQYCNHSSNNILRTYIYTHCRYVLRWQMCSIISNFILNDLFVLQRRSIICICKYYNYA